MADSRYSPNGVGSVNGTASRRERKVVGNGINIKQRLLAHVWRDDLLEGSSGRSYGNGYDTYRVIFTQQNSACQRFTKNDFLGAGGRDAGGGN